MKVMENNLFLLNNIILWSSYFSLFVPFFSMLPNEIQQSIEHRFEIYLFVTDEVFLRRNLSVNMVPKTAFLNLKIFGSFPREIDSTLPILRFFNLKKKKL